MSGPTTVIAWSFTKAIGGHLFVYRLLTFDGYLVIGQTALRADGPMVYLCSGHDTPENAQREAVLFTETMEKGGFEIDAWPMRMVPSLLSGARFLWLGHPKVADAEGRDWDDLWGAVVTHGDDLEGLEL